MDGFGVLKTARLDYKNGSFSGSRKSHKLRLGSCASKSGKTCTTFLSFTNEEVLLPVFLLNVEKLD